MCLSLRFFWNEMKFARSLGAFALVACAAISSAWAGAADLGWDRGWYGGAGIDRSVAKINDARIISTLRSAGFATAAITARDELGFGYKLFAGYQFNRNFALEDGYFDLGRFKFTSTTT